MVAKKRLVGMATALAALFLLSSVAIAAELMLEVGAVKPRAERLSRSPRLA